MALLALERWKLVRGTVVRDGNKGGGLAGWLLEAGSGGNGGLFGVVLVRCSMCCS